MTHIEAIIVAIQYIENNIEQDINIDDVANSAHYSTYHFSRLFLKHTGVTLGSYINTRKLGIASKYLLNSSKSLTDISAFAGYSSYEAFSREIKSKFGISPSHYRKKKTLYYLMNRSLLDIELLNHLCNNLTVVPRETILEEFQVIGYSVVISLHNNQLPFFWKEFNALREKLLSNSVNTANVFSICESPQSILDNDGNSTFSNFLSFENIELPKKVPKKLTTQTIKRGRYIVFEHNASYDSLELTYRYIWNIWVFSSQMKFDNTRKSFEQYTNKEEMVYIYIPVK